MSRRIVYAFALAGCAVFVVPAAADRECFESSCRMPEVLEAQESQPDALVEPAAAAAPAADRNQASAAAMPRFEEPKPQGAASMEPAPHEPQSPPVPSVAERAPPYDDQSPKTASAPKPAHDAIKPSMVVDRSPPALKPRPFAPHEPVRVPSVTASRLPDAVHKDAVQDEEVVLEQVARRPVAVASRGYAFGEAGYAVTAYGPQPHAQPDARVIVVTPAYSYGDDGVAAVHKRNDPSWKLCQTDHGRRDTTCSPYQYHAFGEHGYRPLGSYRTQRAVPVQVYVPNARIVAINE